MKESVPKVKQEPATIQEFRSSKLFLRMQSAIREKSKFFPNENIGNLGTMADEIFGARGQDFKYIRIGTEVTFFVKDSYLKNLVFEYLRSKYRKESREIFIDDSSTSPLSERGRWWDL